MRCCLLFALLLVVLYPRNAVGQRSLLPPSYSTPDDDVLIDYAHPTPNRLVFAAIRLNEWSPLPRWSDGIVFITDNNGTLIRHRNFQHNADSASFLPAAIFTTDSTVELIGEDGYSVPDFEYPVCHALHWIKMDTALNVLEEKRYPLATGRETILLPIVIRLYGYTYVTYNQRYYYSDQDRARPFLLRFDKAMNLIAKRQFDPSFYGTTLNVNGGYVYDLSAHAASGTLFIPAEMRITSSTDSFSFPNDRILHKLDTALSLLNTVVYDSNSSTSNGYDTALRGNGVETLPLDEHRLWMGSVFMLSDVFKSIFRDHVGLSLFNTTTGQYQHRKFAANYDSMDRQSCVAINKGIAQDGAGHVYTVGASHCPGGGYDVQDNALVLVKYDTSGALLWHRFITSGSGFFQPSVIHCDGDSMVTILATRYDHTALFPATYERDYYVVRVRADNGATVAIFPVRPQSASVVRAFPNPTAGRLNIEAPDGSRARLYAPDGRLIAEAATGAKHLYLTGLAAGLYVLRVTDAAGVVLKAERVVKVD